MPNEKLLHNLSVDGQVIVRHKAKPSFRLDCIPQTTDKLPIFLSMQSKHHLYTAKPSFTMPWTAKVVPAPKREASLVGLSVYSAATQLAVRLKMGASVQRRRTNWESLDCMDEKWNFQIQSMDKKKEAWINGMG